MVVKETYADMERMVNHTMLQYTGMDANVLARMTLNPIDLTIFGVY